MRDKFQLLVVTMNQEDLSKLEEMNIDSNVVFSNQAKQYWNSKETYNEKQVKMITTDTVGVGKNRNIGLLWAEAELCLFADDDMVYSEHYEERIVSAFHEVPEADVLIFNVDVKGAKMKPRINRKIKKVSYHNFLNYGAVRMAFRLDKIKQKNIWFSTMFGGGCKYGSGEDNLFLKDCLNKGLKVYTYPYTVGWTKEEDSTWFKGFNEKYYYDKGALCAAAFPVLHFIIGAALCVKSFRQKGISMKDKWKLMKQGMKGYDRLLSYDEYTE